MKTVAKKTTKRVPNVRAAVAEVTKKTLSTGLLRGLVSQNLASILQKRGPVSLRIVDELNGHFIISAERPVHIVVDLYSDEPTITVYDGARSKKDAEPLGSFNGKNYHNVSWIK